MNPHGSAALPNTWIWTTLAEIAETSSGGTPSRARTDFFDGNIPWLKSGELNDHILRATEEFITQSGLESSSAKIFPAGTLCVALYGATVGKLAVLGVDAATNHAVCGIMVSPLVRTQYFFYLLLSQRRKLIGKGKGGAQSNISQDIIRRVDIPLPPLAEQHRIVAKIEELFTQLHAGVEELRKARAQLKRYRQAVLKAAVTGELTKEWREAHRDELEPASELLARILKERRAKWEADQLAKMEAAGKTPKNDDWKKKYREPLAPDSSRTSELPRGWTWTSLDQLLMVLRNGISTKPNAETGIPILRISSLRPMSVNLKDRRFLPEGYGPVEDYRLEEGDLLFTRYNGNPSLVGVCGVVPNLTHEIVHPDKLIRGQVASQLSLPRFLQVVLNVGKSREFISRRARTTAGQTGVSGSDLRAVPTPLAPLEEQELIVEEVERRLSIIESTEHDIERSLREAQRMRQSILKQAFEGKLVPQDPNDEPAELLLERIRIERANREAERRTAAKPRRRRATRASKLED